MKNRYLTVFFSLLCLAFSAFGQTEILSNAQIIEMSKAGLEKQIILKKINETSNNFDVSVNALIELKKADVDAEIITLMLEKTEKKIEQTSGNSQNYSDNVPNSAQNQSLQNLLSPKQYLTTAQTIAIEKSSIHPSRQALEKELMKREDWKKLNLSIVRYKESADLYIEIGRVPFSWVTHRYVFRVYDRRNGLIIAAGETTSWGSLAENMAREISQKLKTVSEK